MTIKIEPANPAVLMPSGASARRSATTLISVEQQAAPRRDLGADEAAYRDFDHLPGSALVSVRVIARLLGLSTSSVWIWVRNGRLPAPIKLSEQTCRWAVADVRRAIANLTSVNSEIEADHG